MPNHFYSLTRSNYVLGLNVEDKRRWVDYLRYTTAENVLSLLDRGRVLCVVTIPPDACTTVLKNGLFKANRFYVERMLPLISVEAFDLLHSVAPDGIIRVPGIAWGVVEARDVELAVHFSKTKYFKSYMESDRSLDVIKPAMYEGEQFCIKLVEVGVHIGVKSQALFDACKIGYYKLALAILKRYPSVGPRMMEVKYIASGHHWFVKSIVRLGVRVSTQNMLRAIAGAFLCGEKRALRLLMEHLSPKYSKWREITAACRHADTMAHFLVENCIVNGTYAANMLYRYGNKIAARYLIVEGTKPSISMVFAAAKISRAELVFMVDRAGVDLNAKKGRVLKYAARDFDSVRYLMQYVSKCSGKNLHDAIEVAAARDNRYTVSLFMDLFGPRIRKDMVLLFLVEKGKSDMIDWFVRRYAVKIDESIFSYAKDPKTMRILVSHFVART